MAALIFPNASAPRNARQAWSDYIEGREPQDVRDDVLKSWSRCRARGLSPYVTEATKLADDELEAYLAENSHLIDLSRPLLQRLYQFLAGSGFAVSLSDKKGILIYVIGDTEALLASRGSVAVGANWSEASVGTNSIGTPLLLDTPCQYAGFQHYCKLPQRWAGSGAPIHDTQGNVLGCVNISGEIDKSHLHTLGMVVMTAQAIDMQLRLRHAIDKEKWANYHQSSIIDSISEGLIILDENAHVTVVNDNIAKRLNTKPQKMKGLSISEFCSDKNLLEIICSYGETTDYISELKADNIYYPCTVTCKVIANARNSTQHETLLLISDLLRAKKLAQRLNASEVLLTFRDIVGEDMQFSSVIALARAAAETSANVLLLGESGTGKEVFAQAIHTGSPRENAPFIALNCAAIPKELIASTLFGYEEGAFTGAKRGGSPGKFELADRGTLFLDEIGELPLDIQGVLLRVLETGSFSRVGGKHTITVDVRVIAATNRDLLYESQTQRFRQDLYYRLNVFSIYLPPLRERRGDIRILAEHFLSVMNRRYQKKATVFTEEAMQLLRCYDWPGNIRELQNTIERALVLSTEEKVTAQSLSLTVQYSRVPLKKPDPAQDSDEFYRRTHPTAEGERETLLRLLEDCKWNVSKAAVELGIARSTLYRKMYIYHIQKNV